MQRKRDWKVGFSIAKRRSGVPVQEMQESVLGIRIFESKQEIIDEGRKSTNKGAGARKEDKEL